MSAVKLNSLVIFLIAFSFLQFSFYPFGRYFLTLVLFLFSFLIVIKNGRIDREDILYFISCSIFSFLIFKSSADVSELIVSFLKGTFLFIAVFIGKKMDFYDDRSRYRFFYLFNLVACLVLYLDFFARYLSAGASFDVIFANFYLLKFGSIVFSDSNGVGMYSCVCFAINILLYNTVSRKAWLFFQLNLILLTIGTFSRSAIVSISVCTFFFLMLNVFSNVNRSNKIILSIFFFAAMFIFLFFTLQNALELIESDGSGITKIRTFLIIPDLIGHDILSDVFGRGLTGGGRYFSFDQGNKYAHAAIPLLLGFSGLLGTMIYSLMVTYPITKCKKYIPIFLMFFVMGLSYLEVLFEGLFLILGMCLNKYFSDSNQKVEVGEKLMLYPER